MKPSYFCKLCVIIVALLTLTSLVVLVGIHGFGNGAPPLAATMISLDHQNFPFIYLSVAVNRYGEGISTLGKNNFQVTENGVLQTDYFDVTPPAAGGGVRTVDIVFLMDNSGSMEGEQSAVREHVIAFVDELVARGVDYRLGLCRFGAFENGGNPIIEDNGTLASNAEYFKNDVWNRNVVNGGFEPGWDALYESATGFAFRGGSQKVFILITDETPTDNGNVGTHTQEEAISILQDHYVTTFALIELSDAHAVSDYGVIAEQTNGQYYDVLEPLDGILDYISGLISNNYRITYKSSNPVFDGTERHVVVTVTYQGDQATCDGTYTPGSAPRIQRTQDTLDLHDQSWAAGTTFTIKVEITDDVVPYVQSATLYYRTTGDATYASTSMIHSSDIWSGTIPGSAVKTPGVDYYISATDGESTATSPPVDPRTRPHQLAILPNVAPQITHTPVTTAMANTPVTITAEVVDTTNVLDSIELWYRKVGQLIFKTNGQMANIGGDTYQDTIPSSYVTEAGVEYCILAYDDLSVGNWHGSFFDPHVITVSGNQAPETTIKTANIDPANGTASFTWSGSDDSTPPAQLVYEHRLLNPDSPLYGWSDWSSSTTATYPRPPDSRLPDGTYRFQVKAKDADGAIQPGSTTWKFTMGGSGNLFITAPLVLFSSSPYHPYQVGDSLTATFSITNRGQSSVTLDELVVGGRLAGEVVDFEKAYNVMIASGETYNYMGSLTLQKPGVYHFFCAYHTKVHMPGEDENNWNTRIGVEVDGRILEDSYEAEKHRSTSISVIEDTVYIAAPRPKLWKEMAGPWDNNLDKNTKYVVKAIAVNPNDAENIFVVIRYMKPSKLTWGYVPKSEAIYEFSEGNWKRISDGLPSGTLWDVSLRVNAIALAPSNPRIIYVGGERRGVYRSVNGGESWESLNGPKGGRGIFAYPARVLSIAVDPVDPYTVYVGTEDYGFWKKSGARDWKLIKEGAYGISHLVRASPLRGGTVYAAGYGRQVVPPDQVQILPWGVLKSQNSGSSWEGKLFRGVVADIAIAGEDERIFVSTTSFIQHIPVLSPDMTVGFILLPLGTEAVYRYGGQGNWDDAAGWLRTDGTNGENPLPKNGTRLSLAINPKFTNMVFAVVFPKGIYYSPNSGDDWFPIGFRGEERGGDVARIVFASDSNSSILYAFGPKGLFKLNLADTALIAKLKSPGELCAHDSSGNKTGFVDGEVKEQLRNSLYYDGTVLILDPTDTYSYTVVGTAKGTYGLELRSIEGTRTTAFSATNVPITPGAYHKYTIDWDALARGEEGVTLQIDNDGDGAFEKTIQAGSTLDGTTTPIANQPPAIDILAPVSGESISGPHYQIQWQTTDPDNPASSLSIDLFYSTNGGSTWTSISSNEANDGAYDWDISALQGGEYWLKIMAEDPEGGTSEATVGPFTISVFEGNIIIGPNPVTGAGAVFFYTLPEGTATAKLMIFGVAGKLLFETPIETGVSRFPSTGTWNPVDNNGVPLANGPYIYVLIADGKLIGQGKMVIQR